MIATNVATVSSALFSQSHCFFGALQPVALFHRRSSASRTVSSALFGQSHCFFGALQPLEK
jgi:hypothetical protein